MTQKKMKFLSLSLVLMVGLAVLLTACGGGQAEPQTPEEPSAPPEEPAGNVDDEPAEVEEADMEMTGDPLQGGLLYDKWWSVVGTDEPTDNHPLWATQSSNTREGGDTWRCKECHGWDYKGADGAYGSGSHFTGFGGVFGTDNSFENFVNALKAENHDFSAVLDDESLNALAEFLSSGLVDMSEYIDYETKTANGDATHGEGLYATTCVACHGSDGDMLNFGSQEEPEYVGQLARDNPWETLHKIQFGHPGSPMPSSIALGWSIQDAVDVLTYLQESLNLEMSDFSPKGGLLYDKWWGVVGTDEPTDNHPLWATQSSNTREGGDTWRCKECHGWDYKGADGAYGSGSHFTGFGGVFGTDNSFEDFVNALKAENHDFSAVLDDESLNALAEFLSSGLVDMSVYIDYETKTASGDASHGEGLYATTCVACHGSDGDMLNFGSQEEPEYVGQLARENPWETLHKIQFGHPGSPMPSSIALGWSIQDAVDVLTYLQEFLNLE